MFSLDRAATADPDLQALEVYRETALHWPANPSSIHPEGRRAAEKREACRAELRKLLGAGQGHLVFTSGATEANNMVLTALTRRSGTPGEIIISAVEHPSVWEPAHLAAREGWTVRILPVDTLGRVRCDKLPALLNDKTRIVAVMAVNNETGALQPVEEIAALLGEWNRTKSRPVFFLCDAVQAAGKCTLPPLSGWGPDAVVFSGHKLGAPRGIGLLWLSRELEMLYRGGGQEGGFRPGTENLAGIAALTDVFLRKYRPAPADLNRAETLLHGLKLLPDLQILPQERMQYPERFTPMIISLSCAPVPGEVMVRLLGEAGWMVSTGSACAGGKQKRTRVLEAMGVSPAEAHTAIRISPQENLDNDTLRTFTDDLARIHATLKEQLR